MIKNNPFKTRILAALVLAGVLASGCETAPTRSEIQPNDSFARKVTSQSRANFAGNIIQDVDSMDDLGLDASKAKSGNGSLAFGGLYAMKGGASGLGALTLLDILGDKDVPDQPWFQQNTLAWMPVEMADSPEEARDKFHAMRVNAIKANLDAMGVTYVHTTHEARKLVWGGEIYRRDFLKIRNGIADICEECAIRISTTLPEDKPVMSPQALTGTSFLAYRFEASKDDVFGTHTRFFVSKDHPIDEGKKIGWLTRDFAHLEWLTQGYPDWAVEYVPMYKPMKLKMILNKTVIDENSYPFVVHKGKVRHFVKGQ